jgi:hypothetical protein
VKRHIVNITKESNIVFIWARFAAADIIKRLSEGDLSPDADLANEVKMLPQGLEAVYCHIINRLSRPDRALGRVILVYIVQFRETVQLVVLQSLDDALRISTSVVQRCDIVDPSPCDIEPFKRKLLSVTGRLAEIIPAVPLTRSYELTIDAQVTPCWILHELERKGSIDAPEHLLAFRRGAILMH